MKLLNLIALCTILSGCQTGRMDTVVFETSLGDIVVEVDTSNAPVTAANFLRYVDDGFYEGGSFYRVVRMDNQPDNDIRIEVIQGGINPETALDDFASINLERTEQTGILHLDGVISMARGGADSATHEIFICIGDQPSLDFGGLRNVDGQGFAAFGRVLAGMDIVVEIQSGEAEAQRLLEPVLIDRVVRR